MNSTIEIKNEIKKNQPEQILTSLNPKSANFNFELWAREVRQQMLRVLQQRLSSSRQRNSSK